MPLPDHTEATSINPQALTSPSVVNEEYCRLPADLAYWTGVYADACLDFFKAKAAVKELEANLYFLYRKTQTPEGKTPSERYLDSCIEADSTYRVVVQARDIAEAKKIRVGGLVEAIGAKRDALISLGANIRKEIDGMNLSLRIEEKERRLNGGDV
jgi:hypothetical protein